MAGSLENKGQLPGGLGTLCKIGANLKHKGTEMCVLTLLSFSASHFHFFFLFRSYLFENEHVLCTSRDFLKFVVDELDVS